jgi:hypothetical protein
VPAPGAAVTAAGIDQSIRVDAAQMLGAARPDGLQVKVQAVV